MIAGLEDAIARDVSRETSDRLEEFMRLLTTENDQQNLIASSTVAYVWTRHILDSAQLLRYAGNGHCLDIGSGAGLPGIVLAILSRSPITLIEPRRLRTDFLHRVVTELGLTNVTIVHGKASAAQSTGDVITARAVAKLSILFDLALHLSRPETVWVLPKGRSAQKELDEAHATWHGDFRLEPSLTDADASILIATGVTRRGR